jgi:hypothetical protein
VPTRSKAEGFKAAGPGRSGFTVRCLGAAPCLAKVAGFREVTCLADLPCVDGFLRMSDRQPASLTSIGRNTNAAIAAMMLR